METKLTFYNISRKIINDIKWKKIKKEHIKLLEQARTELKCRRGQLKYAFEYMIKRPCKFVKQGDLLHYCDLRRNEDTNGKYKNFKDNSRAIEILRKDKLPLRWLEKYKNGELWFNYCPSLLELFSIEIQENNENKNDKFHKSIIDKKLKECEYKCQITNLSLSLGNLAADHWFPKEKGGQSTEDNCVILNKVINEKKNKRDPAKWFCEHLLKNFLEISKKTNRHSKNKKKIIKFIQEYQ